MGQYVKVYVNNIAISEGDNSNPLSAKVNYETKPESDVISAVIRIPEGYVTNAIGITVLLPWDCNVSSLKAGDKTISVSQNIMDVGMKIIIANNEYTIASVDKEMATITLTESLKADLPAFTNFYIKDYDCWALSKNGVNWANWGDSITYETGLSGDLNLYIKARAKSTETAEVRKDCKIAVWSFIGAI